LSSVTAEETAATFYRVWVRKEAVLKAEGCGVGGPLKSFSVAVRTPLGTRWLDEVSFPSSDRVWSIVDLTPAPAHIASVAVPLGAIVENVPIFLSSVEIARRRRERSGKLERYRQRKR